MSSGNLMRPHGPLASLAPPVLLRPAPQPTEAPPPPPGRWVSDADLEALKRRWVDEGRQAGRNEAMEESQEAHKKFADAVAGQRLEQALKDHQEAVAKEQAEKWRSLAQALAGQMQVLREELRGQVSEWTMTACTRLLGRQVEALVAPLVQHVLADVQLDGPLKVLLHPADAAAANAARDISPQAWPSELSFLPSDRVALGGCLIQSTAQTLDARLEVQLDMLRAALDEARRGLRQGEA